MSGKVNKFYFSHDVNARQDEKIIELLMEHGAAGYGCFWMIIESLANSPEFEMQKKYNAIAYNLRVDPDLVKSVVENFGLFKFDDERNVFYSASLKERLSLIGNIRHKRVDAANARWDKERCKSNASAEQEQCKCNASAEQEQCKCNANAMQVQCKCTDFEMQNKIKGKEIKENIKENLIKEKSHEELVNEAWMQHYESVMQTAYVPDFKSHTSNVAILASALRAKLAENNLTESAEDFAKMATMFFEKAYEASDNFQRERWNIRSIAANFSPLYVKAFKGESIEPEKKLLQDKTWLENGHRYYKVYKAIKECPINAPNRPCEGYTWSDAMNEWVYAI